MAICTYLKYMFNVLLLYFKGVYNYTICCDNINIYNNTTNAIYYDNINIVIIIPIRNIFFCYYIIISSVLCK